MGPTDRDAIPFWPTRLLIASLLAREEVPGASVNVRVGGERAFAVALGTRDLARMTAQRADDRLPLLQHHQAGPRRRAASGPIARDEDAPVINLGVIRTADRRAELRTTAMSRPAIARADCRRGGDTTRRSEER